MGDPSYLLSVGWHKANPLGKNSKSKDATPRVLLYDRPMSMVRFLAEMGAAMILITLASGYFAGKTLISL